MKTKPTIFILTVVLTGLILAPTTLRSTDLPVPIPASPGWARALPPAPDPTVKITEEYAKHVARDAFFWAWPLVNVYNKRLGAEQSKELAYAGPVPGAPLNRIVMLTDYVAADERIVACPNQDVVYGGGSLGFYQSPVVVQVPDFGDRFWVYQAVDLRTDGFVTIGKMYGTTPGFYLLVGPDWNGAVPQGITRVFRCPTNTAFIAPRIFMDDTPEDRKAIQPVLSQIMVYPLTECDGKMKSIDWPTIPHHPNPFKGEQEVVWVPPEHFIGTLSIVLADAPPLPGEEAIYANIRAVLAAAAKDEKLQAILHQAAEKAEDELVTPLFQFENSGLPLPANWSTINNGAAFGIDYLSRTAAAKANIFVNKPNETKYFYQDLDAQGARLNGANSYTVTFPKGQTPPVRGFWSLTLYNEHHFFAPNEIKRYSLGTKNQGQKYDADGSLTLRVSAEAPADPSNWLPAPKDATFVLYLRSYWPEAAITSGQWTPPPVVKTN